MNKPKTSQIPNSPIWIHLHFSNETEALVPTTHASNFTCFSLSTSPCRAFRNKPPNLTKPTPQFSRMHTSFFVFSQISLKCHSTRKGENFNLIETLSRHFQQTIYEFFELPSLQTLKPLKECTHASISSVIQSNFQKFQWLSSLLHLVKKLKNVKSFKDSKPASDCHQNPKPKTFNRFWCNTNYLKVMHIYIRVF